MARKQAPVETTHPDYSKSISDWELGGDILQGERAIHGRGETYLPKLSGESQEAYKKRRARTPWFNASGRTVDGLRGLLFRKAPVVTMPENMEDYRKDIDAAGTPLDLFASQVVTQVLARGRIGLLVDHPTADVQVRTKAEEEALGLRPSIQTYGALSIINWKLVRVNNVTKLGLLVLREETGADDADEFSQKTKVQYRVLDLTGPGFDYRVRIFEVDEKGNQKQVGGDRYPLIANKRLKDIPFYFLSASDNSPAVEPSPLLDLFLMNIHHYQVSADWEHGCHYQGLPTMFIYGHTPGDDDKEIVIGGPSANALPDPQAKAEFVGVDNDFEAIQVNLSEKKKEMAVLGARMLEQEKSAVESAETLQQRQVGEMSGLAGVGKVCSLGLTMALAKLAEWAGIPGEVKYQLNNDFLPAGLTPQALTALTAALQAGSISHKVYFDNLQRGEVIDQDTTYEEEQSRIGNEDPGLGDASSFEDPDSDGSGLDIEGLVSEISGAFTQALNAWNPEINVEAPDMSPIVDAIKAIPTPQISVEGGEVPQPAPIILNQPDAQGGAKVIQIVRTADGMSATVTPVSQG